MLEHPDQVDGFNRAALPPVRAVSLRFNVSEWQYNLHNGGGWITCPDQAQFIPPMKVSQINVVDAPNIFRKITYDLIGYYGNEATMQFGIMEMLESNKRHTGYFTKVYLDETGTDATYIVFLG
jgi:hypothetical protein